jgi:hypothetical protein
MEDITRQNPLPVRTEPTILRVHFWAWTATIIRKDVSWGRTAGTILQVRSSDQMDYITWRVRSWDLTVGIIRRAHFWEFMAATKNPKDQPKGRNAISKASTAEGWLIMTRTAVASSAPDGI